MGTEAERHMRFHCPLGNDMLWVRNFSGSEQLGSCFEYVVTLFSEFHYIDPEALLGKSVTVEVTLDLPEPRFFNGIVCEFSHLGTHETFAAYRIVMRPWFWMLSRNRECRVFQSMTTLDIKSQIFGQYSFAESEENVFGILTPREYCVQYRESDFAFLSRLFEHEGIYYYFRQENGLHTLMLTDSISAHDPAPGFEEIHYGRLEDDKRREIGVFYEWSTLQRVQAGRVRLNDYDFKKSRADLGVLRAQPKSHDHADGEIYEYPGRYAEVASGEDNAKVRLEEAQVGYDMPRGVTDTRGLSAGVLFKLKDHPREEQNREYLVVSARYDVDSGSYRSGTVSHPQMTTHVTVLDKKIQFRPIRTTPIPAVAGPQTARVVGPKSSEIWTNEFGQVKVQFAWDRWGSYDENSSCWVRVSQAWAGSGWGGIHIPRIGQEVLVDFLDGDLDRPIIVGRVYNDYNKPPYDLPTKATQSGIKSRTVQGTPDDYNELRFEDLKQKEEIVLHAQRDLTTKVRHDSSTDIGNNHTHQVKKNLSLTVKEGKYESIVEKGPMQIDVKAADYQLKAKTKIELSVGACTVHIDETTIVLTSPAGKIVLDAMGVAINGTQVKLNS